MLNRLILIPLYSTLLLGLSACQSGQEPLETASSTPTPANAPPVTVPDDPDPALWVLKDEDTTIYLFGTIHILKPGLSWFDEAVKDAFEASDELVVEMVEPDPTEMIKIVQELAIDSTGVSLRDKLSTENRADFEAAMTSLNLPTNQFDPLDPWFASVSMSLIPLMQNGYDPSAGVEKGLTKRAKAKNLKIVGLETPRQQLGFFDNLPEEIQINFLNFTVDSLGESAAGMENMVAQWALGDTDALAAMMNAGLEDKILYETLLINRNANWALWVEQRMKQPGTVFMAVGAGHLAGKGSLQAHLKKKGLNSSRIDY